MLSTAPSSNRTPVPANNFFFDRRRPFDLATWSRHPFTEDSDDFFFQELRRTWGDDAVHAFALAVAPYVHRGPIGIPRISVQLLSDEDWHVLTHMQSRGAEINVWPFRIPAASSAQSRGVWEDGEVQFLQDDALWRVVQGAKQFTLHYFLSRTSEFSMLTFMVFSH